MTWIPPSGHPYVSMFSSFSVDEFLHASSLQNDLRIQACCSTFIPKADDVHSTYHNVRSSHVFYFIFYCLFRTEKSRCDLCFVSETLVMVIVKQLVAL